MPFVSGWRCDCDVKNARSKKENQGRLQGKRKGSPKPKVNRQSRPNRPNRKQEEDKAIAAAVRQVAAAVLPVVAAAPQVVEAVLGAKVVQDWLAVLGTEAPREAHGKAKQLLEDLRATWMKMVVAAHAVVTVHAVVAVHVVVAVHGKAKQLLEGARASWMKRVVVARAKILLVLG